MKGRPNGQVGRSSQQTDSDHTLWKMMQPEHNIPGTESTSSQFLDMPIIDLQFFRKGGTPMPVETSNTKATASPPKATPETTMKREVDNPSDNVQTSRPKRIIRALVKYGYE